MMIKKQDQDNEIKLFGPNNHSNYAIEWVDIPSEQKENIAILLKREYSLDAGEVATVNEWQRRSNNFRIDTDNGRFLLRKNISIKDRPRLMTIEKITAVLRANGLKAPKTIPAKNGDIVLEFDNHLWQLFEFIPGNHYRGTKEELEDAAENIARLHQGLAKLPGDLVLPVKLTWDLGQLENLLAMARAGSPPTTLGSPKVVGGKSSYDKIIAENADFIMAEAHLVQKRLRSRKNLITQPIHRDLHPQNTIYENDKLRAFLDFEDVSNAELCQDFANGCFRFVRQYVVHNGGIWQEFLPGGLKIFFEKYLAVNEIPEDELRLVPDFIRDELLRKFYSAINKYYKLGSTSHIDGGEIQKLLGLLMEVKCIEETI